MEPRILRHVRNFCHALGAGLDPAQSEKGAWGLPLDMANWCSYLTFDIMVDIVFGVSGDLLVDPSKRSIVDDIGISSKRAFVLLNAELLYLGRMDRRLFPGSVSSRRRFLRLVDELVARSTSLSAEEKSRAIVQRLLAGRDADANGGIPDSRSLISDATTLTVAGMLDRHFLQESSTDRSHYNRIRHNRASPQRHVLLPKPLPIRLQPPRNRNPPTVLLPRRNQTRRVTKQLHLPARLHRRDTADHPARPHGPLPGGPPRRRADRRTRRPRGIPRRHQRVQPPPSSGLFPPAK